MKQTIISILMLLLPLMANAEAVEIDGIYYNLINKAKQAEVTLGSNKYTGNVIIPSSVVYNDVTYYVTSIGDYTFQGCSGLTSVTIPNSVTSIGQYAFYGCSGLTSVTIPNSITSIGDGTFGGCSGLTSITIPNSVTSIGSEAFQYCSGLTSITIPNSLTSIGEGAFFDCTSLTAVYITDLDAWYKIEFTDWNSNPLLYAHHLYLNGKEVKELVIPNSVTSIGQYAFYGCSGLTSVTIPNSITSIGDGTFGGCSGLTSVTIPNSLTSIGEGAFYDCTSLTAVYITDLDAWYKIEFTDWESNPLSYAHHLYLNGNEINELVIPNSVTSIGRYAFSGCSGLTSVTIPNSITSIGDGTFGGCSGLTSVTIPNSITSIGDGTFGGCSGLTSVSIPNSVTSIGRCAFQSCSGLTSFTIPNLVTSIGDGAFWSCSSLTSITIGSGVKQISEWSIADCPELTDVYCYAENVPSTNTGAFDGSYIEHATLHVPASALNAYSNTKPWSNFKDKVAIGEVEPSYSLTYMLDGKKYVEFSLQEGETITPEPAPSKGGYTFSGWSEIPATMPNHDVTITGTFIENTYLPGDANGDGQITVTDIGVIVDIILGKTPANARKQQEAEPQ